MATLLVAVVGATFAYFTATNSTDGTDGGQTTAETAKIGNSTFTLANESGSTDSKLDYPGGIALIKAKASASVGSEDETDSSYDFEYGLKITSSGDFGTALKWHLYELDEATESSAKTTLNGGKGFNIESCQLVKDDQQEGNDIYYYYTTDGQPYGSVAEINDTKSCTATTLGFVAQIGSREIASGELGTAENMTGSEGTHTNIPDEITVAASADGVTISGLKISSVRGSAAVSKYYYLIVEYPNSSDQTETDKEKTANVQLKLQDNSLKTSVHAE